MIRDLFKKIHFSETGATERIKEEATYMLFLDLLHECEGSQECGKLYCMLCDIAYSQWGNSTLYPILQMEKFQTPHLARCWVFSLVLRVCLPWVLIEKQRCGSPRWALFQLPPPVHWNSACQLCTMTILTFLKTGWSMPSKTMVDSGCCSLQLHLEHI